MDLKSNRFMVAGGVHVVHGTYSYDGAAFSEYIDYKRAYFLPITTEPDRWTFLDEDYSKPVPGRVMPGDAFAFPDTAGEHAFVLAKQAQNHSEDGRRFQTGAHLHVRRVYADAGILRELFAQSVLRRELSGRRDRAPSAIRSWARRIRLRRCTDVTTRRTASILRPKRILRRPMRTRSSRSIR